MTAWLQNVAASLCETSAAARAETVAMHRGVWRAAGGGPCPASAAGCTPL